MAEKYFNAVVAAYRAEKTIKECIVADKLRCSGASEFVGWGGLGPIANLIEYIIGLEINVPAKTILWRISQLGRHGIQNLKVGACYVDLICEARRTVDERSSITVNSGGEFDLTIFVRGQAINYKVHEGTLHVEI